MATATATETTQSQAAHSQVREEAHGEIERHSSDVQQRAEAGLDRDAVAAIEETLRALKAVAEGKNDAAIEAIERATGKIDVLISRNPSTALLPVAVNVAVIDTAPDDLATIHDIALTVDAVVIDADYPAARALLERLVSEIRVRTFYLPLATYPIALRQAAQLLDRRDSERAGLVLHAAVNTLATTDRVSPLPLLLARIAVTQAEKRASQDRESALAFLDVAGLELDRAVELGYRGKDEEYKSLRREMHEIEKRLKGREDAGTTLGALKEKLSRFFKRLSESDKPSRDDRKDTSAAQRSGDAQQPNAAATTQQRQETTPASS